MNGGGQGFGAGRLRRHLRGHLRRHDGRRAPPLVGRPRARRRPALQHGDLAGGSLYRQDGADQGAGLDLLHRLLGLRRQARHAAGDLHHVRRPRQGARHPGLLLDRAHLPDLPGPRPDDQGSLPQMLRARAASSRSARCRSTFRPASRTAPASGSPTKARRDCAAGPPATSTSSCRSSRTSSSSATAPTSTARCRSR